MATIPASELVQVVPSVLGAGGSALDVIGLLLTESVQPPIGSVLQFSNADDVADYFGPNSIEASSAQTYFAGFEGSDSLPATILFAQYNSDAVAAYLRGGDVSSMTLAELTAISGTLIVVVDGGTFTVGALDLAAATSFSSAATIIQTAIDAAQPTVGEVTASIAGTTMTVTAVGSGALAVGNVLSGSGVTAGTRITALGTGTGGTGTYTVSASQTVASTTITAKTVLPVVSYDTVAGAFKIRSGITGAASTLAFATGTTAADLELTSATGAVVSQGAAAAAPASFMNGIVAENSDWVTFMTVFDPDDADQNSVKEAFADWVGTKNNRYAYVCWDTDDSPAETEPASSSLGQILEDSENSGTCLLWAPDLASGVQLAAFVCGVGASIDFERRNGRVDYAYRAQSGITGTVTDATTATNLGGDPQTSDRGNGYNFYGAYGAASESFVWLQRGFVTGPFAWMDSFINQVWLNSAMQIALLAFLASAKSVPYNAAGYSLIEAALADPIEAGLNFGAFAPGSISASQQAQVNAAAGRNIANTLQTQGYYLLVADASSSVRAARGSPPMTFFYLDRGSVQAINLSSVAVQ